MLKLRIQTFSRFEQLISSWQVSILPASDDNLDIKCGTAFVMYDCEYVKEGVERNLR